jgi:hypothetical protein
MKMYASYNSFPVCSSIFHTVCTTRLNPREVSWLAIDRAAQDETKGSARAWVLGREGKAGRRGARS